MYGTSTLFAKRASGRMSTAAPGHAGGSLVSLAEFGTNPGALTAKVHLPDGLTPGAALVVVLHGCTQTAQGYDDGAGWSQLADECGFAVLYPEQTRGNNPNLCFNWFQPADTARGSGEAASIRHMIARMVETHALDPARVFITGLSAGGAMTAAMLAAYPDVFASGAIIAGLPSGSASSVPEALQAMRRASAGARVAAASDHDGRWPSISVWHGDADRTVDRSNADAIVDQWRDVHGVVGNGITDRVDGHARTVWHDAEGRAVIESVTIADMGHGVPLAPDHDDPVGSVGAYMLDHGISSTRHIAQFWGLAREVSASATSPKKAVAPNASPIVKPRRIVPPPTGPAKIIEDALRAAGLMH